MTEELLYEGKAKKVFTTDDEGVLVAPLQGRRDGVQRPEARVVEGQGQDQRDHERGDLRLPRDSRRPDPLRRAGGRHLP